MERSGEKRGICVCQSGGLPPFHIPLGCHQCTEHHILQHRNPSRAIPAQQSQPSSTEWASSSQSRKCTANSGQVSCPLLKSFTLAGFVFKRKKPLPEPFECILLLSRSGRLMPVLSRHALVRSPRAASCDWCWVGRSQGPNYQLWSLGDSGIKREGGRSDVW